MTKKKYYAVAIGKVPGIYSDWESCNEQVRGFSHAKYKSFANEEACRQWYLQQTGKTLSAEVTPDTENELIKNVDDDMQLVLERLADKLKKARSHNPVVSQSVEEYCQTYFFEELSPEQKEAVGQIDGKFLLFAVPGSGKTTVIIARTGYLLHGRHNHSISPSSLITMTFTKAAAQEMKERYSDKFSNDKELIPKFCTIHSFCYNEILPVLKRAGYSLPSHLLGDEEKYQDSEGKWHKRCWNSDDIVKNALKSMKKTGFTLEEREILATAITNLKNRMVLVKDIPDKTISLQNQEISIKSFYNAYEKVLHQYDYYDFDDMLRYSVEGLEKHPEVLTELQNRYQYWNIDEAQDNSLLQNTLLQLLIGNQGNLFVVGDDDQSIYAFRGASPKSLLKYGIDKTVQLMVMGTNFRSDNLIVDMSREFIQENKVRADKEMHANLCDVPGQIDFYVLLPSQTNQYRYIIKRASQHTSEKESLAVIYRQNISALPVAMWLKRNKISFSMSKKISEILQNRIISDAIAIIDFVVHPESFKLFKVCCRKIFPLINVKSGQWKIWLKQLEKQHNRFPKESIFRFLKEKIDFGNYKEEIVSYSQEFKKFRERIAGVSTYEALCALLKETEYLTIKKEKFSDRLRWYALLSAAEAWPNQREFIEAIHDLNTSQREASEQSFITLTSMHGSKGLQFDEVLIIDALEPPAHSSDEHSIINIDQEEERRLFYVAMTRAKQRLSFLTVQAYHGNVETASHFIAEAAYAYESVSNQYAYPQKPVETKELHSECVECKLESDAYYAVRIGRHPGIYTNWQECKEQIDHFSGAIFKKFDIREEAQAYLDLGDVELERISCHFLDNFLVPAIQYPFNRPIDLPVCINQALLQLFGVSSLRQLNANKIEKLRNEGIYFKYDLKQKMDYHGHEENYVLTYFPLHFYKSWLPLSWCASKNLLSPELYVLELGPGPGTSALALISFYSHLARENNERKFSIHYDGIETEEGFIKIFDFFVKSIRSYLPENLSVDVRLHQGTIYNRLPAVKDCSVDLFIESNVLNVNEKISSGNILSIVQHIKRCLKNRGQSILIEPRVRASSDVINIWKYFSADSQWNTILKPETASVDIGGISVLKDIYALGLRHYPLKKHSFITAVYEKEV